RKPTGRGRSWPPPLRFAELSPAFRRWRPLRQHVRDAVAAVADARPHVVGDAPRHDLDAAVAEHGVGPRLVGAAEPGAVARGRQAVVGVPPPVAARVVVVHADPAGGVPDRPPVADTQAVRVQPADDAMVIVPGAAGVL